MELEVIKKLIKDKVGGHSAYISDANIADLYYDTNNDIERSRLEESSDSKSPLRTADNRVSHNFYQILVDQTAAYMFTYPPTFDTGNKPLNKKIMEILGDKYQKTCKDLSIDASNHKTAWLHVWKDSENRFRYAIIDGREVIPLYSGSIDHELIAVLRKYLQTDDQGKVWCVYEYWTDKDASAYRCYGGDINALEAYQMFSALDVDTQAHQASEIMPHDWGVVPFIEFANNNKRQNDLKNVKKLIDVYDKVLSGYINDIEDIQQVIFLLEGYGGTDLDEFLGQLRKYKVVDMQNRPDQRAGMSTLSIEIPVEARNKLAEIVEKNIYRLGQGVDINPDKLGQAKGVVIDHLYGFLELKAGLKETEFRLGFGKLVRMILKYLGENTETPITQTWQRNKIRDDLELSQIIANLAAVTSRQNIAKANPLVEDWEEELSLRADEAEEDMRRFETPDLPPKDGNDA
ncbi:phage portal protein [Anaerotruncus rubiinfantis]|uniref:phage portal protein n=1 Tax=Anaerotruncus rubiinfantis TaxID=1720200 RepID=UPI003D7BA753